MTARDVVVAVIGLIIGWAGHILWYEVREWARDVTGHAHGFLWDLLAWVGVVAVCAGGLWWWSAAH